MTMLTLPKLRDWKIKSALNNFCSVLLELTNHNVALNIAIKKPSHNPFIQSLYSN